MLHGQMKPPKEPWWDRLALVCSNVDLATVNGPASHPLLCRRRHTVTYYAMYCRFFKADKEFYLVSEGAMNNKPEIKQQSEQ